MRRFTIVAISVALTACAAPPSPTVMKLAKPGATYQEFLQDRYACITDARTNVSSAFVTPDVGAAQSGQVINRSIYLPCMAARGYTMDPNGFAPPVGGEVAGR